ncbi:IucC family-domain-containing protein [Russula earlei]|uniref:IucC family-domain-containing protein n=1 Tax=Russula earlei TaxID=71964 RepID=A0ACC0U0X0_9AGAM|nr:IucC family-domain-containing protein [Russula earlei]
MDVAASSNPSNVFNAVRRILSTEVLSLPMPHALLAMRGLRKDDSTDPPHRSPHSVPTWILSSRLQPSERAAFAVTSRLLAAFVTESLLRSYYFPLSSEEACGVCIILSAHVIGEPPIIARSLRPVDIFAVIPLHQEPLFSGAPTKHGRLVSLLDPLDMIPSVFDLSTQDDLLVEYPALQESILSCLISPPWQLGSSVALALNRDPLHWWRKFAANVIMGSDIATSLAEELSSSYIWQRAVYENPPICPTISSPAIQWEQSIVEGHPAHPMHRARHAIPPLPRQDPQGSDWKRPQIRFAVVSRSRLDIVGHFEQEIRPVIELARLASGMPLPERDGCIIVPVHDVQIANVRAKFPGVETLDEKFSVPSLAQASTRTIVVPEVPDIALKLSIGIRISSALRTISHFTANFGPRFSRDVVPKLAMDPSILFIEPEIASAICARDAEGVDLDPDIVKHFTTIIRKRYAPDESEAVIICAALLETGHLGLPEGVPIVQHIFGLDTTEKRLAFFHEYSRLLVAAVVPPLLHNGVAFEAHPQNMLLRASRSTLTPTGFVIRDLGGLRVHPETLTASIGTEFAFLPHHCVVTATREEPAKKLYHTMIHNHLQRLARVLRLHGDGSAWSAVRAHLTREIPRGSWLWSAWMDESVRNVPGKCLVRMKLEGVYRESVYEPFPNLIHYRPEETDRKPAV